MYAANGRLIYGHKPFQVSKRIKQAVDRGLLADLPHRDHRQMVDLCRRIFESYRYVYIVPSAEAVRRVLWGRPLSMLHTKRIVDPAYDTDRQKQRRHPFIAYYRPHLPMPKATILLPLIPFPLLTSTQLVCSAIDLRPSAQLRLTHTNAFDSAAIIHTLRGMEAHKKGYAYSDKRSDIIDPLACNYHRAITHWKSNGNYLHSALTKSRYATLFSALLGQNILINPIHGGITLLPPQMPKKEYLKFIAVSDTIKP